MMRAALGAPELPQLATATPRDGIRLEAGYSRAIGSTAIPSSKPDTRPIKTTDILWSRGVDSDDGLSRINNNRDSGIVTIREKWIPHKYPIEDDDIIPIKENLQDNIYHYPEEMNELVAHGNIVNGLNVDPSTGSDARLIWELAQHCDILLEDKRLLVEEHRRVIEDRENMIKIREPEENNLIEANEHLRNKLADLMSDFTVIDTEREELKRSLEILSNEMYNLQHNVTSARAESRDKTTEIGALKEQATILKDGRLALEEKIHTLLKDLSAKDKKWEAVATEWQKSNAELAKRSIKNEADMLALFEERTKNWEKEWEEELKSVEELKKSKEVDHHRIKNLEVEIVKIQERYKLSERQLDDAKENVQKLQSALDVEQERRIEIFKRNEENRQKEWERILDNEVVNEDFIRRETDLIYAHKKEKEKQLLEISILQAECMQERKKYQEQQRAQQSIIDNLVQDAEDVHKLEFILENQKESHNDIKNLYDNLSLHHNELTIKNKELTDSEDVHKRRTIELMDQTKSLEQQILETKRIALDLEDDLTHEKRKSAASLAREQLLDQATNQVRKELLALQDDYDRKTFKMSVVEGAGSQTELPFVLGHDVWTNELAELKKENEKLQQEVIDKNKVIIAAENLRIASSRRQSQIEKARDKESVHTEHPGEHGRMIRGLRSELQAERSRLEIYDHTFENLFSKFEEARTPRLDMDSGLDALSDFKSISPRIPDGVQKYVHYEKQVDELITRFKNVLNQKDELYTEVITLRTKQEAVDHNIDHTRKMFAECLEGAEKTHEESEQNIISLESELEKYKKEAAIQKLLVHNKEKKLQKIKQSIILWMQAPPDTQIALSAEIAKTL